MTNPGKHCLPGSVILNLCSEPAGGYTIFFMAVIAARN